MITFQNVSFTYANEENPLNGVKDINLHIKKGECVLLCGESGCGKTTLIRLMNGLIPHYFKGELSGIVKVGEKVVSDIPQYELSRQVGTVFQNPKTQFFNIDVDSEIVFGSENHGMNREELKSRLEETFEILKLQNLKGRNIFELSGGEKQKVAFASIYHMNPEVFLLDEPSSNLDLASIYDLKNYVKEIKKQGKTVVLSEHRIAYLKDVVDRVIYLSKGRIVKDLSMEEFLTLTEEKRQEMGLRAVALERVHPIEKEDLSKEKLLWVKDLSISRKKKSVLEGISFEAKKGEIIGIIGRNGAGKTTLLRTLCGLHKEYKGEILYKEHPFLEKERCKASYMVMQDVNYQLFAESVEAECCFGIKDADPNLVKESIQSLELEEVRLRHPNTLSGGQKQRVALAVSLVSQKEVFVLDEPTSGLDYISMEKVSHYLKDLAKFGVVFVVTHDYEFLCKSCTRLLGITNGLMNLDLPVSPQNEEKIRSYMES